MSNEKAFEPGELFIYVNGDLESGRFEIGKVKGKVEGRDAYFCHYHEGETAACTPVECMHKLTNAYAIKIDSLGGFPSDWRDDVNDGSTIFGVPYKEARLLLSMYRQSPDDMLLVRKYVEEDAPGVHEQCLNITGEDDLKNTPATAVQAKDDE